MAAGAKKRAARSQIGPKTKKIRSGKPQTKDEKLSVVKRGRPVTLPQTNESDGGSDEEVESSSEGDAELADEDEEMLDVPAKDPNGGRRIQASELSVRLMDRTFQLQKKPTRHRKFSWTSARHQSLTPCCSETPNGCGVLPGRNTLARSGRITSLTS